MRRRLVHGALLNDRSHVPLTWSIGRNSKMPQRRTCRGMRRKSSRCTIVICALDPWPLTLLELLDSHEVWPFGLRMVRELVYKVSGAHGTVLSSFIVKVNIVYIGAILVLFTRSTRQFKSGLGLKFRGFCRYGSVAASSMSTVWYLPRALSSTFGFRPSA